MFFSPYFPHVLYSVALTSISINLVSRRKIAEDERSRINAQISILDSIKQQLQSKEPLAIEELERLKRLARPSPDDTNVNGELKEKITWADIFTGKGPAVKDVELSKWDKEDLEKLQQELSK